MSTDTDSTRKPPKDADQIAAIGKVLTDYGKSLSGLSAKMVREGIVATVAADGTDGLDRSLEFIERWVARILSDYKVQCRLAKRPKRKRRKVLESGTENVLENGAETGPSDASSRVVSRPSRKKKSVGKSP